MGQAGDILEARETVVAAQAAVVLEKVQSQRKRHGLRQDREVHARDTTAEGEPAEDQRQQAGDQHNERQLRTEAVGEVPHGRNLGAANDTENLGADPLADLQRCRWQRCIGHGRDDDVLGALIHQPHADHVAAETKEGEMTQGEDAAVAPDQIHRQCHETQTEGLAQRLHEGGGDEAGARRFGQQRHGEGK